MITRMVDEAIPAEITGETRCHPPAGLLMRGVPFHNAAQVCGGTPNGHGLGTSANDQPKKGGDDDDDDGEEASLVSVIGWLCMSDSRMCFCRGGRKLI